MNTSRRKSAGEDEDAQPYRAELVARLEQAVREGRYRPDPKAIAAAMIDRMDELLD
jgi:anti-sigma28 factor (negative regulator of flagellin synthesis)